MYSDTNPIGLFKGFAPTTRELEVEIIVPHGDFVLPSFGEFILIEMERDKAAVGRVIHYYPTGPLASKEGENYLAEMGKSSGEFPDDVRKLVLRYTMKVALLGCLKNNNSEFSFEPGIRSLAKLGMHVRKPSEKALSFLVNVGIDRKGASTVEFGHLAIGSEERKDIKAFFDIDRLKSKRTFVFARAGYGKSNLIKYLLSRLFQAPPDVGLLIFDPEGEYALPQGIEKRIVPGLASLPALRRRINYFTLRSKNPDFEDIFQGGIKLDFSDFTAHQILNAFVSTEKHDQVWANWVKGLYDKNWRNLLDLLCEKQYKATDEEIMKAIGMKLDQKQGEKNVSLGAIKNNLIPPIQRLHDSESKLARNIIDDLKKGRIYIVDLSLTSSEDGLAVAGLLMTKVFYNNVQSLTGQSESTKAKTLVVLEEAQSILGGKTMSEQSIFVRWVKEGRKYDLGAVLITQQPGAIANEILSQGDNFFVMHLLNQFDLDALQRVNSHYALDIINQIRNEPIKGNCFFWSAPDQPYVICAKVKNFDLIVEQEKIPEQQESGKSKNQRFTLTSEHQACIDAINNDDDAWIYRVKGKPNALLVSREYLRTAIVRKQPNLSNARIKEIISELKWHDGRKAELTSKRGKEFVIVFPKKYWNPKEGKKLLREVVITKADSDEYA